MSLGGCSKLARRGEIRCAFIDQPVRTRRVETNCRKAFRGLERN